MTELLALTPEELQALLPDQPAYRAGQVFRWLHKGITAFDQMSDLPAALRQRLGETGLLTVPEAARVQTARDGTVKILWRLSDGQRVESVLMRHHHGESLCLSTQAGCRQGCLFCASTVGGLVRNLTAAEMLAQVQSMPRETGRTPDHLVLMGIGEPLDNFNEVVRFLTLVSHPQGLGLSLRRVSLSTCGLIDGIRRLAALDLPLTLSVSLHAPDDETRSRLMPVNRSGDVERLLAVCRDYFRATGRRVSYEYLLLDEINDTPDKARALGRLLRGAPAHVNLILYNQTGRDPGLRPSKPEAVRAFRDIVSAYGPVVTLRRSLGGEIDAACGQLRGGN
ncbi:MAG: 23S rRNA (adenine(2503)-C(2))-methyltransferase RlmN [Oscillospiraceae bacterium]|jgi:23S rRNA (adenine2503-C2)-methyltransferase|nr:23S rRNA (adenine(2503)-C(2))-methyltransferase RlmN [Oscillospiraceae bacterium]